MQGWEPCEKSQHPLQVALSTPEHFSAPHQCAVAGILQGSQVRLHPWKPAAAPPRAASHCSAHTAFVTHFHLPPGSLCPPHLQFKTVFLCVAHAHSLRTQESKVRKTVISLGSTVRQAQTSKILLSFQWGRKRDGKQSLLIDSSVHPTGPQLCLRLNNLHQVTRTLVVKPGMEPKSLKPFLTVFSLDDIH